MAIERELKYRLKRKEFLRLHRALRDRLQGRVRQSNYYFDAPDLSLRKLRLGLRVRIEDGSRASLTVKGPSAAPRKRQPVAFKARWEHEVRIPLSLARRLIRSPERLLALRLDPIRKLLAQVDPGVLSGVTALGRLTNTRSFFQYAKGIVIELDRFEMFGQRHYELEVETPDPIEVDRCMRRLLKENGIAFRPCRTSKLARFLEEWKARRRSGARAR